MFADPDQGVGIVDVWEMRAGDFVTITNRCEDLPSWFELHPTEVCGRLAYKMMERLNKGYRPGDILDGPNLWRLRAGDRLAWTGSPRHATPCSGSILAVLDFREAALAIGETNRDQTMEESVAFGSLTTEGQRPENAAKCHEAVMFVRQMGVPRTLATDWQLG